MSLKWVPASELDGTTPGEPGGIIAISTSPTGKRRSMTATDVRALKPQQDLYNMQGDVVVLQPTDLHPDDFRTLSPGLSHYSDVEIREAMKKKQAALIQLA